MSSGGIPLHFVAFVTSTATGVHFDFPDLPGCFGDATESDWLERARDALERRLRERLRGKKPPPSPRFVGSGGQGTEIPVSPVLALAIQCRRLRLKRGWSQAALALKCGLTQQQIARLESPKGNPTFRLVSKVAAALGQPLLVAFT